MTRSQPLAWGSPENLSPKALLGEFLQDIPREWRTNYRYQGVPALMRCLWGTQRLLHKSPPQASSDVQLDCVSFSVIPEIARLWIHFLNQAIAAVPHRVCLGESSGNAAVLQNDGAAVLPLFNFNHGIKLDLFMNRVCSAPYVLICDDDIFWTDDAPLQWALARFAEQPKLAVVSLHPRPHKIPQLRQVVPEAMGSYCLVVRRDIWLREQLSFKYYKPADWKTIGNYFDTADYANLKLIERGYTVEYAPEHLREHLVTFYGTSMWGIKILASRGAIEQAVNPNRPDEHKKAYRTALALLGFQELLANLPGKQTARIPADYLQKALETARTHLDDSTRQAVEADIQGKLNRMRNVMAGADQTKSANPEE